MFQKNNKALIFQTAVILIIFLTVVAFILVRIMDKKEAATDNRYAFASCLTEKGVKMYGAYWCPHCQEQKKTFGKSFKNIDYVECAVPGSPRDQKQVCQDARIASYPTWVFSDGSREEGVLDLETLSNKSGCELVK